MGNEIDRIQKVLDANKNKNFVDRIINPDRYPVLNMSDGRVATHMMAYSEIGNGKSMVYPSVVFDPQNQALSYLPPNQAADYAQKTGEFIELPTDEADWFSKNYKKVWKNG